MATRRKFNQMLTLSLAGSLILPGVSLSRNELKRIKVGQIGTGHSHAEGKIETVKRLRDIFDIVGIAESDPALLEINRCKSAYAGLNWMSVEDLLHTKGLQAVLVETDLPDLLPVAEKCIATGLPIHLDKPAGKDYQQFNKIVISAKQKNLVLQMGYMFRYNPAFIFCLQAVQKGWLGKIFEIDGVISKTISADKRGPLIGYIPGLDDAAWLSSDRHGCRHPWRTARRSGIPQANVKRSGRTFR